MRTVTATVPAWLTSGAMMTHDEADEVRKVSDLAYWEPYNECNAPDGWIKVGEAQITVTFFDDKEINAEQVSLLKEAKKRLQADTQQRLNAIDEQISKLTCLEYKP